MLLIALFTITLLNEVAKFKHQRSEIEEDMHNQLKSCAEIILESIDNCFNLLESFSTIFADETIASEKIISLSISAIQHYSTFDNVVLLDKNGITHTQDANDFTDFSNYSFFIKSLNAQKSIEFFASGLFNNHIPNIVLSVPVMHDGKLVGVLFGTISITNLTNVIKQINENISSTSDALLMVQNNGLIIASSNSEYKGDFFALESSLSKESIFVYEPLSVADKSLFLSAQISASFIREKNKAVHTNVVIIFLTAFGLIISLVIFVVKQQKLINALKTANDAKGDFLAHVSHDIRTPLNAIIGITSLAIDEEDPQIKLDYLHKVNDSGKYLLGLINDTLDMSKIENAKITLHPEPLSFNDLQTMIKTIIEPKADEKNIHLVINQVNLQPYIMIDKLRTEQILINLLNNAVKFTPAGGTVTFSTIALSHDNKNVIFRFTIRDTGVGMSEEFMNRMFIPFEQERNRLSVENSGTGLGLAIVKSLVDMMDGTITCTSRKNSGTKFVVELTSPIATEEQILANKHIILPEDDELFSGKCILVAEDNKMNMLVTRKILEKKNITVESAPTGRVALEKFLASEPGYYDAILMDIHMPEMNGLDATVSIRESHRSDSLTIPIIALSANAYDDDVKESLSVGMNGHVAKPIENDILFSTLKKIFFKEGTQYELKNSL